MDSEVISPLDLAIAATEHRINAVKEWKDVYCGIWNEAIEELMQERQDIMMRKIAEKRGEIMDRLYNEFQELMQKSAREIKVYADSNHLGHVVKFFKNYKPNTPSPITVKEKVPQEESFVEDITCVMDCLVSDGLSPAEVIRLADDCLFYHGRFYDVGCTVWIASSGTPMVGTIRSVTHGAVIVNFKEGGRLVITKEKLLSGEIQLAPEESPEELL